MKIKPFKQFLNEFEVEGDHIPAEQNAGVKAMLDIEHEYMLDLQGGIMDYVEDDKDVIKYVDMMLNEIDEYKDNMSMTDEQVEEFEENLYLMKKYYKEVFQYCVH